VNFKLAEQMFNKMYRIYLKVLLRSHFGVRKYKVVLYIGEFLFVSNFFFSHDTLKRSYAKNIMVQNIRQIRSNLFGEKFSKILGFLNLASLNKRVWEFN
jgi:hypothetical protein